MKKKPSIILLVTVIILTVLTSAIPVLASTPENSEPIRSIEAQNALITKADPYVSLNHDTKQFELLNQNTLSENETKTVNEILKISNKKITDALNEGNILEITKDKIIRVKKKQKGVRIQSINTSLYWDYTFLWWGERIYLSNNCVNDLKAWGNTVLGGIGITAATLSAALVNLGIDGGPAGVIAAFYAGYAAYTYDSIINSNTGYGVYCDSYYGTNYWSIYSAW